MRMYKLTTIPSSGQPLEANGMEWSERKYATIIIQQTQNRKYLFIYYYLNRGKEEDRPA